MSNIKYLRLSFGAASALALAVCAATYAQDGPGQGQRPRYDSETEVTVRGVVEEIKEVPGPGRSTGTHLFLKTNETHMEIHVGPSWYLKQQKCVIAKGDQVEVTGSKVKLQEKEVLLARELKKSGNTWTLRNAQGVPLWSRGKHGL